MRNETALAAERPATLTVSFTLNSFPLAAFGTITETRPVPPFSDLVQAIALPAIVALQVAVPAVRGDPSACWVTANATLNRLPA